MSINDFEIHSSLGKGSFGSVNKVKRKEDGQYYAMKKVPFIKLAEKEKENALNEVRLIASIKYTYHVAIQTS
jgi:serine/threonine protein kinase